jgi:hypothetical protein
LRLGEFIGLEVPSVRAGQLNPRSALRMVVGELRDEAVRIEWQLTEDEGKLLREPPKDGSKGDVDLPPFLSRMLEEHVAATAPEACPCHGTVHVFRGKGEPRRPRRPRGTVTARVIAAAAGVSPTTVSSVLYGASGTRVSDELRERVLEAAEAAGWQPLDGPEGVPDSQGLAWHWRQSAFEAQFTGAVSGWLPPKAPLKRRPVPLEGEWPGRRLRGRAVERASLRWDPIAEGMVPHGLRHSVKTRLEEAGIPEVASETWLRHEIPGVSGAYLHASPEMRRQITALLQEDWLKALDERLAMSPGSPVGVLDRALKERAESRKP